MLYFHTPTEIVETGYGGAANAFALELHRRNYSLVFSHLYKRYLYNTDCEVNDERLPSEMRNIDVQIYFGQPFTRYKDEFFERSDIYGRMRSLRSARAYGCFTMFESKELPPDWVDNINNVFKFDFLIVPSMWCKKIFEDAGVKCPVHYVPLGVDPHQFPYLGRPADRRWFNIIHRAFYIRDRKGGDLLLEAFRDLKDDGEIPDARLFIKTVPFMSRIKDGDFGPDQYGVHFIEKKLNQANLLSFLQFGDLAMHPTSGEGFGLMPLEDMATGLPVAVSNNTACAEYADRKVNFPINCFEQSNWFEKIGGLDMRPDYDHIREIILWSYDHRDELREMGKRASQYVRDNWTYEQATDKLLEVVKQYE